MNAFEWTTLEKGQVPPAENYCRSRDVADARLGRLVREIEAQPVFASHSSLLTAIAGELTNNCFDHNLGAWHDIPGCWLEWAVDNNQIRIIVADRGQGFLSSLKKVKPELDSHSDALLVALTLEISGRAPEKRGKGLKFVMHSLNQLPSGRWVLQTGNARFEGKFPLEKDLIPSYIQKNKLNVVGSYSEISYAR